MNQPFIQIGTALVNISAIAAVVTNKDKTLSILFGSADKITVHPPSADAVWRALQPFTDPTHSGVPDAAISVE